MTLSNNAMRDIEARLNSMPLSNGAMRDVAAWLAGGDTGLSSRTIASVALGVKPSDPTHPHDPSDFGRCYQLLQHAPEVRNALPEVARQYPRWKYLVANWDRLTELHERDISTGYSSELYREMQLAIKMAEADIKGVPYVPSTNSLTIFADPLQLLAERDLHRALARKVQPIAGMLTKSVVFVVHRSGAPVITEDGQELKPIAKHRFRDKTYALSQVAMPCRFSTGGTEYQVTNADVWTMLQAPAQKSRKGMKP